MKGSLKIFYISLVVLVSNVSYAQKETANWIFGGWDNWMVFTDSMPIGYNPPTPIYPWYFMSSARAATISDPEGNLLLYTNGETIWNGQLSPVPNGSIYGDMFYPSVIIKRPRWDHRYYVLCADGYMLEYKEINMPSTTSSGNVVLNYTAANMVVPKFSTTYHANGKDIWLLTHERDTYSFKAYLITEQGIGFTAVTSTIGSLQQDTLPCDLFSRVSHGVMVFSPGGNYVAMSSNGLNLIEVFDFDNETGLVCNVRNIPIERPLPVAFSSNGTFLYFAQHYKCLTSVNCNSSYDSIPVYQIDLLAGNDSAINASIVSISNPTLLPPCDDGNDIQLAMDQKIYCNWSGGYITVINNPNLPGLNSNWEDTGVHYNNYFMNMQALPDFFTSYMDFNIEFENLCFGDSGMIYTLTNQGFDSIRWEFEDTLVGLISIPNQDTIYHTFSVPGDYEIALKRYRNGNLDELKKILRIIPAVNVAFASDTIICEGAEATISVSHPFCDFAWVNDFSTDTVFSDSVTIAEQGGWWPIVTNFDEYCGNLDTLQVSIQPDTLDLGPNGAPNCILNPVVLDAGLPGNCTYQWSTGDTTASILATDNGYYMVTVQQNYCTVYDTILIAYDDPIQIQLFDTLAFCDSLTAILDAGDYPADFLWSPTGETTAAIVTTSPGLYTVTATNACGSETDSTLVQFFQTPSVNLGNDTALCFGDTLWLHNLQSGAFEPGVFEWSSGDTVSQIPISGAGTYSLTFTNICGSDADTVVYGIEFPPLVNLGNDTVLCEGSSIVLGTTLSGSYLWSPNGETTATIVVSDQDVYSLSVSNACGTFSDTVSVMQEFPLVLNLGTDTAICTGDSVFLQNQTLLPTDPGNYLWSTGDNSTSIYAFDAGLYSLSISNVCGTFSDSLQIIVDTALIIDLGNDTTICLGENLLLHTPYSAYSTYLWSTGETATSITVFNQSNYSLSVSNACGTYSDSLFLEVYENLFAFPFDSLLLPSGQTITIDAGPGYASYFWSNDSTSQSITVGNLGIYWVEVSDSIGCLGSDTVELVIIDGISETTAFNNIKVYPNPVKDELVIDGLPVGEYEIYLFNCLGQKAAFYTPNLYEDTSRATINFSSLPIGLYLLRVQYENEMMVFMVVKE